MWLTVRRYWSVVRSSVWFVPTVMVLVSIALAIGLIDVDDHINSSWLLQFPRLFGARPSGSRAMLSAIASSMINVAALTFSLTIVAIAQVSGQYTSRVLRTFMSNRPNQFVLGWFLGVFTYALIVLRTVRGGEENIFNPSISVFAGLLLAIGAIGVLVFFIHHIARQLQASHIISTVAQETNLAVDRLFPTNLGEGAEPLSWSGPPEDKNWTPIPACKTGYIQTVHNAGLLRFARERGVIVRMEYAIGQFVVEGSPLVSITPAKGPGTDASTSDEGDRQRDSAMNAIFSIGRYRTIEEDAAFGLRQIVDIALKALSPGVNDTTTAVVCVDYLGSILTRLASRNLVTDFRADEEQAPVLRVIAKGPTFEGLMDSAFSQIRRVAEGNVAVLDRLLASMKLIGEQARNTYRRNVLARHVKAITKVVDSSVSAVPDRVALGQRINQAMEAAGIFEPSHPFATASAGPAAGIEA